MNDNAKPSKFADEIKRLKTSELVNYLAHPQALHQRFPPPPAPANPFGFGASSSEDIKQKWFDECSEWVQAVADELDRRVPGPVQK